MDIPWMQYQQYLDQECWKTVRQTGIQAASSRELPTGSNFSVGIIGGGMTGLYSALLLQQHIPDVKVKIFEASERVGGRVFTHKFSSEPFQYFDAGAMRIPVVECHKPVFTLVDHLNKMFPDDPILLKEYFNTYPKGNRLFYNNTRQKNGCIMSVDYGSKNGKDLGFQAAEKDNAVRLLQDALKPVFDALKVDFKAALKMYSNVSVYDYLSKHLKWTHPKIKYVEVMTGSTNEFRRGLIDEIFCLRMFDNVSSWQTIEGGMSKLPELCAQALYRNNAEIVLNSKIEEIMHKSDENGVILGFRSQQGLSYESFDAVIIAIPPPFIRMIRKRPYWGPDLEHALRTVYFEPASAMGMRFKSRFWERPNLHLPASLGGRSITDLPIRRVVYPSHGIGDNGKGVLCIYTVDDDAKTFKLLPKDERIELALENLQVLYPEVNVWQEYAGGDYHDAAFVKEAFFKDWSIGALFHHPEDFFSLYSTLVTPQGSIFFAGGHLTPNPVWIVGALESARRAVQQLLLKKFGYQSNVVYL